MGFPLLRIFVVVVACAASAGVCAQAPTAESRAQVAGALSMIAGFKPSIAEAFAVNGRFPDNYQDAGVEGPAVISYASARIGSEGVITITFNDKADPALRGKIIKLVPMASANLDVIFYCLAPALPEGLRPAKCH
jgi:hypothetical protein